MRFIIVDISSNCFSSLFTSCTLVPEPAAMRFFRLAFSKSGLRRSATVIELIIAAWRLKTVVSKFASASACLILPTPGSIPMMPDNDPILEICFS